MWSYALGLGGPEGGAVGVFDYFEFVLLVGVEEAVEGGAGEEEGFCDQGGEGLGEEGHFVDVGFVGWAEGGEECWVGPLVRGTEIVVEGVGWGAGGVRGGYVYLFSPLAWLTGFSICRRRLMADQSTACLVISLPSLLYPTHGF